MWALVHLRSSTVVVFAAPRFYQVFIRAAGAVKSKEREKEVRGGGKVTDPLHSLGTKIKITHLAVLCSLCPLKKNDKKGL